MSKLPDFEGLAMFARVAEERSFARAARALGVSIATVSRAVARLEDRLGGRLFNRSTRRLSLTELGATIAGRAARLYAEADEIENTVKEGAGQPRGVVKLAVPSSFGIRFVAPLLPDFLRQYPEVTLDIHFSDAPTDVIADGYDAALRVAILEPSTLAARIIAPVRRQVLASPTYLERFGHPRHPDDLSPQHCLRYANRSKRDVWRFAHATRGEATLVPAGPLRVSNADALLPALLEGVAVAELPEFMAAEHLDAGRLVPILPGWELKSGGLYFVTPTTRARTAKVTVLGDFLVSHLATAPWRRRKVGKTSQVSSR